MNAQTNFDNNTGLHAEIKRQKWYDDNQVQSNLVSEYTWGPSILLLTISSTC